jgi:hypothetical protein
MARFSCGDCREEGECAYRPGTPACPRCGSRNVRIAASIMELPDDDPLWVELREGSGRPSNEQHDKSAKRPS